MLRSARPIAVRKPYKRALFIDWLHQHPGRLLNDLVLDRGDPERTTATVAFRDVHATDGLWVVAASMNAVFETTETFVEILAKRSP